MSCPAECPTCSSLTASAQAMHFGLLCGQWWLSTMTPQCAGGQSHYRGRSPRDLPRTTWHAQFCRGSATLQSAHRSNRARAPQRHCSRSSSWSETEQDIAKICRLCLARSIDGLYILWGQWSFPGAMTEDLIYERLRGTKLLLCSPCRVLGLVHPRLLVALAIEFQHNRSSAGNRDCRGRSSSSAVLSVPICQGTTQPFGQYQTFLGLLISTAQCLQ